MTVNNIRQYRQEFYQNKDRHSIMIEESTKDPHSNPKCAFT